MYQQTGQGFVIEGPLRANFIDGITIDKQDLFELLANTLQQGAEELCIERVRMTVEVLDE